MTRVVFIYLFIFSKAFVSFCKNVYRQTRALESIKRSCVAITACHFFNVAHVQKTGFIYIAIFIFKQNKKSMYIREVLNSSLLYSYARVCE